MAYCFILSGLVISCYVGYKFRNFYIPLFNFAAIIVLWFYSTTFKKKLLIGNILVSLLTAWVILVLTFSEYRFSIISPDIYWKRLLKVSFIYAGFAFIISLIREVIKDMEDMQGDAKYGSTTMPISMGIAGVKSFYSSLACGYYMRSCGSANLCNSVGLVVFGDLFFGCNNYSAYMGTPQIIYSAISERFSPVK